MGGYICQSKADHLSSIKLGYMPMLMGFPFRVQKTGKQADADSAMLLNAQPEIRFLFRIDMIS
jgi:hypothetical protein